MLAFTRIPGRTTAQTAAAPQFCRSAVANSADEDKILTGKGLNWAGYILFVL
jgi:hypothetical protein